MNSRKSVEFSSSASESRARPGRGAGTGLLEDEVENNKQQEGLWTIGHKNKQDQYWGEKNYRYRGEIRLRDRKANF